MKKRITSAALLAVLVVTLMCSCFFGREHDITYVYGDRQNITVSIPDGALALNDKPVRDGYVFGGWYTDSTFSETFDFSYPPTSSITLYAKWIDKNAIVDDYKAIINSITQKYIRATVQLKVEKYDLSNFGYKNNVSSSKGSGVIFAEHDGYYYCLTNNHVVSKAEKSYADISVTDYQTLSYANDAMNKDNVTLLFADPDYDLAVVKIKKKASEPLEVLKFEYADMALGETVIAIGSPGGQMNAITIGEIVSFETVTPTSDKVSVSNVTFPVITHTAPIDKGSSGGVLLNPDLKIVGINYAAASDPETEEYRYGCAVPTAKVIEFLNKYDLQYLL